ncbi:hypothetical protein ANCCAN_13005 [Ancylostoma caninum]|uniref:Uncharacterized protein n=1 Tax=Ancylostoma caninum TaxID=29170 RepID=A0A368GCR0_ANCCA|nr:hypothetical protein ANCCAN_13005 [Ancylostoma caninum]
MSSASLHASTAMLDRTGQSASPQNIHSSACNVACEEAPQQTHMANASLHASNAMLDRTGQSASRQNIHSSACNVAYEKAPQQTHMSNASMRASTAMLDRTGESASRQSIVSACDNEVLPKASTEIVVPRSDRAEKPPMRISMVFVKAHSYFSYVRPRACLFFASRSGLLKGRIDMGNFQFKASTK